MADSVGSLSVYGSSDELTDPYCDPCFKDGTIRPVAGYCPKCVEFYCQSCFGTHRRSAMTERHKILLGSDMPACQADKPMKYQVCDKHDGEDKDRYCFDHGSTICGICFIREHKRCQVKHVSDACKNFNMPAEEKSFSAEVDLLFKYVNEIDKSINSNKTSLEKQKTDILKEALSNRDKSIKQIYESYQDFSDEVTRLFKLQSDTLSDSHSAVDQILTDVDPIVQSLRRTGTKKQTDQQRFLELQELAEKLHFCDDKVKLLDLKCVGINCTLNTKIQPLVATNCKLGELSMQNTTLKCGTDCPNIRYPYTRFHQESQKTMPEAGAVRGQALQSVKLTLSDKINVKLPNDQAECNISGLAISADGNMLAVDRDNFNVKQFSPNGKFLVSLELQGKPIGVTVTDKTEAAVSMLNKQISIIDIVDSGHLSLKRTIKMKQYVWAITAYNKNLIVTCNESDTYPRSVQMIDMTGKMLWILQNVPNGEELFLCARFLTTCPGDDGDTVIVTDWWKKVITVIDARSGNIMKVCDAKGKDPRGVSADENGNIYMCYRTGQITRWSRGMQKETVLAVDGGSLPSPLVMLYNSRRSELAITSTSYNTNLDDFIHRYKISMI